MAHSDAVTNRYGIKFERRAPCLSNSILNYTAHPVQMNMSGYYLAEAVGNADKRLVYVLVVQSAGMKQPPVGRTLKTLFNHIASHLSFLSSKIAY